MSKSLAYASALNAELGASVIAKLPLRESHVNHDGVAESGLMVSSASNASKSDSDECFIPSKVSMVLPVHTSTIDIAPTEFCVITRRLSRSTACRSTGLAPTISLSGASAEAAASIFDADEGVVAARDNAPVPIAIDPGVAAAASPHVSNFRGVPMDITPGDPTSNHMPGCRETLPIITAACLAVVGIAVSPPDASAPKTSSGALAGQRLIDLDAVAVQMSPSEVALRCVSSSLIFNTAADSIQSNVERRLVKFVTHIRRSTPLEYTRENSRSTSRAQIDPECMPANVCTHRCWPMSHTRIVRSLDAVTHFLPLASTTMARTVSVWPLSLPSFVRVRASHTRNASSVPPETKTLPSALTSRA
mmetsp:Transcript_3033/g.10228  ORF Transcript_3033/g.10228 Transcript_3033/m.10228 type:complete len:362 (+) Transcript_3033:612-1697(+)